MARPRLTGVVVEEDVLEPGVGAGDVGRAAGEQIGQGGGDVVAGEQALDAGSVRQRGRELGAAQVRQIRQRPGFYEAALAEPRPARP